MRITNDDQAPIVANSTAASKRELYFTILQQPEVHIIIYIDKNTCDICYKQYKRAYSLTRHKRTHATKRDYVCNLCNRSFTQLINLRRHTKTHTGEKNHKCEMCNRLFARADVLKIHRERHEKRKHYEFHVNDGQVGYAKNKKEKKLTFDNVRTLERGKCEEKFSQMKECRKMHPNEISHLTVKPIAEDTLATDELIKEIISAAKLT